MGIFRGVGGTGESSSDSAINAVTAAALAASNSATAAASSASSAGTSATNAASSASGASSSATSATNSATNAATSATNAASSATSASGSAATASTQASNASTSASAASTSATNAAASASSASSSASTATTQAGIATTKASEASTSATNAASSASAASTSATNAASSASTASTAATTATTKASEASTSATNAASSASSASSSASTATTQASNASTSASNASTSASGASTSATNAAASASTATTQASNASTSATNAASSASAASTSASNASTSATNAAASASTATTQASNASTSASNASTSATSAASSAAAAASALDSFDDRYLGTKASDPTLDNDGNALATGALYFNTTQNVMKVYDGASWIAATSAGATSLLRFRYVATSRQTTFSGADSASATLTYTVNNIEVMRNGVTLDTSEYTASNGTSIVLTVAAGIGDIIDIIAFKSFTVADALSAVSGGVVNGAVTITGVTTVQAGTAALPAITTTGDTNTGIFFPAADTIAFSEGGAEAMRIDSSGNVGIGTTSVSSSTKLEVSGNVAGHVGLRVNNASTSGFSTLWLSSVGGNDGLIRGGSTASVFTNELAMLTGGGTPITFTTNSVERMRIDSSGNVGIGTNSPGYKLEVVKSNPSSLGAIARFFHGPASNRSIEFGVSASSPFSPYIQSRADGSATTDLALQPDGGNLLVGTTTQVENSRLTLSGGAVAGLGFATSLVTNKYSISIDSAGGLTTRKDSADFWFLGRFGSANCVSSNGSWINSSDERLKENIKTLSNALTKVCSLRGVSFNRIDSIRPEIGLIAQEVEVIYPDAVETGNDFLGLNYGALVGPLVEAVKELKALTDAQASTITALTARITALENT